MKPVEWFRDEPLPEITPGTGVFLGGRRLLGDFVDGVSSLATRGRLSFAVPFITGDVTNVSNAWSRLPHRLIRVRAVTRPASVALLTKTLGQSPWRSLSIVSRDDIHAKVYGFASGTGACLIGSHTLPNAALTRNAEFGIMYRSLHSGDELRIVHACLAYIDTL